MKRDRQVGRPRVTVPREQIVDLRSHGCSWRQISRALGAGVGTVRRIYQKEPADALKVCQNPIPGIRQGRLKRAPRIGRQSDRP